MPMRGHYNVNEIMVEKTISEINERIKDGCVRVITADEMSEIVKELGPEEAAKEVNVVTTGTFGAMCSSGVFFNFGHADPPIKMQKVWLNVVEAYTGVAAVEMHTLVRRNCQKIGGWNMVALM